MIDIILLDKPRHLKQHDRGIQIEDTKTSKLPFVWNSPSSKPIARIISEEPAASRLTFLSSNSGFALNRNAKQGVFSQLESDEDLDPSDEIGDSTRARLLQSMRAKLFEQCIPEDRGVFVEIRSRLISIIADDWNLLLSQMRQTLDEIDCKISDDHELHENVPVWRRILCSWRVNIIEYSSRLSDVHRLAEYHAQPHKEKSSTRRAQHCRIRKRNSSISSTSHLDDEEAYRLMERYEDIKIGLADISGRVDRSFQALMSSMSIVESGKAISQGTAVARLTELAFFFIPLNFACSFFSMQITVSNIYKKHESRSIFELSLHLFQNFSGNKQPSIGAFFGLGFGLVLFLYGLRGAIRSRLLSKFREKLEKQIRETSGLPSNSNIPTQVVLNYGWQEINPYIRVFLVTLPAFALILALTISLSHHKAFKISVAVVLGVGAFPIIGNFLAGNVKRSLRYTIGVAWLIAIFSVTLERTEHLEVIVTTAQCVSLATVFVAFLTLVPGTFRKPWESATQIILPLWMAVLPIGGILHSYLVNVPHWEPWVLTIGLQAIVIFFGSFVGALRLDFYRGIPEIAALIGVIVGIPTSIIWQYLPSHGNPVPQYAVIILTFSCSIICCIFLWCIPRLRRLRFVSRISASAQTFCVLCITAGMPIALAWAYYPTYGRVYTNVIDYNTTVFAQPLSSFYGTPIHLWIQVSINLGALVLLAIAFTIHALFTQNTVLLFFAWLISGIAVIPWLPILLYIDDIEAFEVLTRNHWKRKLLAGMSVVFWVTIWAFLWYSARRYLVNKWPKELSYDEAGSELESQRSTSSHDHGASDDSSTCGNVSSSGSLRQGVWVKADEGEYSVY